MADRECTFCSSSLKFQKGVFQIKIILSGQCASELSNKLFRRLNTAGLKPLAQYMEALRACEHSPLERTSTY